MKGVLVVMALLALPVAGAVANSEAVFQPSNVDGQWQTGQSLRVCPTAAPISDGTLTYPDATTATITADSEGCFALTMLQVGAYSLSWDVAGPTTKTVSWNVSGTDWAWYVELFVVGGLLLACFIMGWWFMAAFPIAIFPHLLFTAWPFDLKWALPFLFLGIILEWVSQRWKLRRRKETKVVM